VSRWTAVLAPGPVAAVSLEEVIVTWTSALDGTSVDPTGQTAGQTLLTVQFAFPLSSGNPAAPAGYGYVAQCLTGPGGVVTLAAGKSYDVWSMITGTPESPARYAGTLPVI
jgi:hypothetical protein